MVDDGLALTKSILQFNSADYHFERYFVTAAAKCKESAELYNEMVKGSNVLTVAALAQVMAVPMHWSGDQKSISLLVGTKIQSSHPCPLCRVQKIIKIDSDKKKVIANFDEFYNLDPEVYELRRLDDWNDQKLVKKLKLSGINPVLAEHITELGHETIEDVLTFSPLHFKLSYYRLFDLVDASRLIIDYDNKKEKKTLSEKEEQQKVSCKRIDRLIRELQPLNKHNGAENWTGKQIDNIFAKVGDLQQKLYILGLRDELVNEFLVVTNIFAEVVHKVMGKHLLDVYEQTCNLFMEKVVHIFWRRYRGGSNLYAHGLGHILKKCRIHNLGLSSLVNDQQIENCHQHVKKELEKVKAGKGKDDFQASDMDKANKYPGKVSYQNKFFLIKLT